VTCTIQASQGWSLESILTRLVWPAMKANGLVDLGTEKAKLSFMMARFMMDIGT
jgi:hypothetical protein